jgi:hypothetical protein
MSHKFTRTATPGGTPNTGATVQERSAEHRLRASTTRQILTSLVLVSIAYFGAMSPRAGGVPAGGASMGHSDLVIKADLIDDLLEWLGLPPPPPPEPPPQSP